MINKSNLFTLLMGITLGGLISYFMFSDLPGKQGDSAEKVKEKQPLYWVAPMDPNFKKDKPGKSPMGMDLIPVYADSGDQSDNSPGIIRISPEVINNLGVRTTIASVKALQSEIKTVGFVKYNEDKLVHIHPRVQGWIEKLHIKAIGDPVIKNQAIYDIYAPELVNAQEEFILALERKNTRLIKAAENRLMALQIPKKTIEQLRKTRTVSQTVTFFAPQSGVLENLTVREGYFVKPETMMMSIGALEQIWVEAEVFERQAGQVVKGTPVTMKLDFLPGKAWRGTVDYIYPTLDVKTRAVKIRLRFENKNLLLKPNMFAQVKIHIKGENTLQIPIEALIRTGDQDRVVLALEQGRFKSVSVQVGRFGKDTVEILSGLNEGDKLVSSAQFLLDSESSKTSDFKRMNYDDEKEIKTVWTEAKINTLMPDSKMVNVDHLAIADWNWPEMTMDFKVADNVGFSNLKQDLVLHIEITKLSHSSYQISAIHIPDENKHSSADPNSATATGIINNVMANHKMLNISRGPIEKWNRPAATLDFIVNETIDISLLKVGMAIDFTFEVNDGEFTITELTQNLQSKNNAGSEQ